MKIFDETKTIELTEFDMSKGYLKPDQLLIEHHEAVEGVPEKGHYEVTRVYPNGGKIKDWVVDVPGVPARDAWDEYEDIQVYVLYTEKELAAIEIRELKGKLNATDYLAIKYAEGILTADEYAPIKAERQAWRDRINELEEVVSRE